MPSALPRLRIEAACQRLGRDQFIGRCVAMLAGGEDEPDFLVTIGGAPALHLLSQGLPIHESYWPRVWAARGLLWAGRPTDAAVLRAGLEDVSWRVREMTCKVIASHFVDELLDEVAALEADPVTRVQNAAARAARRIIEGP